MASLNAYLLEKWKKSYIRNQPHFRQLQATTSNKKLWSRCRYLCPNYFSHGKVSKIRLELVAIFKLQSAINWCTVINMSILTHFLTFRLPRTFCITWTKASILVMIFTNLLVEISSEKPPYPMIELECLHFQF